MTVNYDIPSYENYLAHHGIKGQKWGVRRFQNYDGTRIKSGPTSKSTSAMQAIKKYKHSSGESPEKIVEAVTKDCRDITSKKVSKKEAKAIAEFGLKALQKLDGYDMRENGKYSETTREWFLIEDQTIGKPMIADLVRRGYSAKQCDDLINIVSRERSNNYNMKLSNNAMSAAFELTEGYNLSEYAKCCEAVRNEQNQVSHAVITNYDIPSYENYLAHHGVKGMKWGHHKAAKSVEFEGQGGGGGEPLEEETAEDIKGDIEELIREGVADEVLTAVLKGKEVDTDAVNEALQKAAEKVPKLAKAAAKEKVQKAIDNAKNKLKNSVSKNKVASSIKTKVRDTRAKMQDAKAEREKERNHKRLQKATKKAAKSLERYKKKKKKQEEWHRKHFSYTVHEAQITSAGHAGKDVKHSDISAYQNYLSHHGLSM